MRALDDVKLLRHRPVKIDVGLCDHVEPLVREPSCDLGLQVVFYIKRSLFDSYIAVVHEALPGEDLVRRPAKGVVPLSVGAIEVDVSPGLGRSADDAALLLKEPFDRVSKTQRKKKINFPSQSGQTYTMRAAWSSVARRAQRGKTVVADL